MPFAMNESTAVHLADQDAGISRRRQAGGVDPDQGRRPPLWPARRRQDRRDAEEFVAACEEALELSRNPESGWLAEADLLLSATSWDTTQARMAGLIADVLGTRSGATSPALLVAAE